jgi:hypothetical protein
LVWVNNRTITKHDRRTGEPLLQFAGDTDGPFEHLDSAAVVGNKLSAVHSNYPEYPMESSIEVFDTRTLRCRCGRSSTRWRRAGR